MNGEGINQSFRDLPQAWSSMGRSRQIGFAVGAVVVIAVVVVVFNAFRKRRLELGRKRPDDDDDWARTGSTGELSHSSK